MKALKLSPLFLMIAAGTVCGILRGKELVTLYDDYTGLYKTGTLTFILLGVSAAALLYSLFCALGRGPKEAAFTEAYKTGAANAALGVMSGLVMSFSGALRIYRFVPQMKYAELLFGLLTLLCGISIIALAFARKRGRVPEMTALGAVLTVFWACFMLVLVFMEHPVEPVELMFFYDLIAMCLSVFALYSAAAGIFGRKRMALSVFASLGAVFFLLTCGVGRVSTFFFSDSAYYITQADLRLVVYLALLLYAVTNASSLLLNTSRGEKNAPTE